MPVMVIAEIGVNHNGDMELAKEMILAAKKSGADAVKFQTFKASSLVSPITPKVNYQKNTTSPTESHYDMIHKLELGYDEHFHLKEYCDKLNINFLSTPYDIDSAKFLHEELDVSLFKIASADIVDLPLHKYVAKTGKPTLIAVGMATIGEIEKVVDIYNQENNKNIILLHCVSNYPCQDKSINIRVLDTLRDTFQVPVGYSDHSVGSEAAILSIAFGVKVIEKHFTLDKNLVGPDHRASSTPDEFYELVKSVRRAEVMLGNPVKKCQDEEREMAQVSRKSICLKSPLKKGEIIEAANLILLRPGTGVKAEFLDYFSGKKVNKAKSAGEFLLFEDLM